MRSEQKERSGMAKERMKRRPHEQGKEAAPKKDDDKSQKERLVKMVEETKATEEVEKERGQSNGQNEIKLENVGKVKEQAEKLEAPPDKQKLLPASPPEEVVLKVLMHCEGCAKKVRKSLKGLEGVEDVKTDCMKNTVVVKGKKPAEDPKKVAETLYRKSGKRVEILSPAPLPLLPKTIAVVETLMKKKEEKTNNEKEPQGTAVVVLKVHMHCEACAEEIKKRIQKLSGVQEVETTLDTSQVKVKGYFDPNELVKYIYKCTGKHASIIKQEQMPVAGKPENAVDVKPANNSKAENKEKDEKKEEKTEEKPKDEINGRAESSSSPATVVAVVGSTVGNKETGDQPNYYYFPRYPMEYTFPYPHPYQYQYQYQYLYPPPPQMFSDENPNACAVM